MLTTRTINPLPFEHLEPHRFEDLVRQLVYDFRPWRALEATGRAGQDQGVDIRGIAASGIRNESEDIDDDGVTGGDSDQVWIIQCKREQSIGPKQLVRYVAEVLRQNAKSYGLLFAASAEFSVKARDAFRAVALDHGIQEMHLWGRSELEDRLVRPENDHLLFAYFGLSLNIRRRTARAELARRIAIKRKLQPFAPLEGSPLRPVLLRDPSATDYPFIADFDAFIHEPAWMYYEPEGHYPINHLAFNVCWRDGWIDWETGEWDIPRIGPSYRHADRLHGGRDTWEREAALLAPLRDLVSAEHRASIKITRWVSYDCILAIDEIGDAYNESPHLLIERTPKHGFFEPGAHAYARTPDGRSKSLSIAQQINFFPRGKLAG